MSDDQDNNNGNNNEHNHMPWLSSENLPNDTNAFYNHLNIDNPTDALNKFQNCLLMEYPIYTKAILQGGSVIVFIVFQNALMNEDCYERNLRIITVEDELILGLPDVYMNAGLPMGDFVSCIINTDAQMIASLLFVDDRLTIAVTNYETSRLATIDIRATNPEVDIYVPPEDSFSAMTWSPDNTMIAVVLQGTSNTQRRVRERTTEDYLRDAFYTDPRWSEEDCLYQGPFSIGIISIHPFKLSVVQLDDDIYPSDLNWSADCKTIYFLGTKMPRPFVIGFRELYNRPSNIYKITKIETVDPNYKLDEEYNLTIYMDGITPNLSFHCPRVSPDGQYIAYTVSSSKDNHRSCRHICLSKLSEGEADERRNWIIHGCVKWKFSSVRRMNSLVHTYTGLYSDLPKSCWTDRSEYFVFNSEIGFSTQLFIYPVNILEMEDTKDYSYAKPFVFYRLYMPFSQDNIGDLLKTGTADDNSDSEEDDDDDIDCDDDDEEGVEDSDEPMDVDEDESVQRPLFNLRPITRPRRRIPTVRAYPLILKNQEEPIGSYQVMTVFDRNKVIVRYSDASRPFALLLGYIRAELRNNYTINATWIHLLTTPREDNYIARYIIEGNDTPTSPVTDDALLLIRKSNDNKINKQNPTLVFLHSYVFNRFADDFFDLQPDIVNFARAGFNVLLCNTKGSCGYGNGSSESVMHPQALNDIYINVQYLLRHCAKHFNIKLDRVALYSKMFGSNLAVAWLVTKPNQFCTAIWDNPACDSLLMYYGSDACDISCWQLGLADWGNNSVFDFTQDEMTTLISTNIMRFAEHIKAPSLFLMCELNRRVPVSISLRMKRMLASNGVSCKGRLYRSNEQLRKPSVRVDAFVHSYLWLCEHIRNRLIQIRIMDSRSSEMIT